MITIRETEIFKTWIRGIEDKITRSIITARIRRISSGSFGDTKPIGEGIFELRVDYGPGYRVCFTHHGKEIVILLCGGDKSAQDRDIKKAKKIAQNLEEA